MHDSLRQVLAEVRTLLADQSDLKLEGLDVGNRALRPRPAAAAALGRQPSGAPIGPHHGAPAEPAVFGRASTDGEAAPDAGIRLRAVQDALGACTRCRLAEGRKRLVFGDGSAEARLVFVGEGPGANEDRQGLPFVGEAGQLLGRMLTAMKLRREQVYITNVIKCRPPQNRFPEADEQASCSPFLWRQLAAIRPAVVVALGRLASHTLLGNKAPMGKLRGSWHALAAPEHLPQLAQVPVMPTFHPAYLLRRPEDKILVWRDLQAVMARL